MGILYSNAVMLAEARRSGACFERILTIGHLTLFLSQAQIRTLARRYQVDIDATTFSTGEYADRFFEVFLGAKKVLSLDCSNYEHCSIVHDMNKPIAKTYFETFDVVIDGGSLEHIFNFPVALANCMNLVKRGGSLFIFSMANNHLGHGFYQFSPELFFRAFRDSYGYETRSVVVEKHPYPSPELSPRTACYEVVDPAVVKTRVGLVSRSPALIMVHALRTEIKPVFNEYPIQSDYAVMHAIHKAQASESTNPSAPMISTTTLFRLVKRTLRAVHRRLPQRWQNTIEGKRQLRRYSLSNRSFYRKWKAL